MVLGALCVLLASLAFAQSAVVREESQELLQARKLLALAESKHAIGATDANAKAQELPDLAGDTDTDFTDAMDADPQGQKLPNLGENKDADDATDADAQSRKMPESHDEVKEVPDDAKAQMLLDYRPEDDLFVLPYEPEGEPTPPSPPPPPRPTCATYACPSNYVGASWKRDSLTRTKENCCTPKFEKGTANSKSCEDGTYEIQSPSECEEAAEFFGKTFEGALVKSDRPRGCYQFKTLDFYMNDAKVGVAHAYGTPVCSREQAKFVKDQPNTITCPHGSYKIIDVGTCQQAAVFFDRSFHRSEHDNGWPKGCYQFKNGYFYFNEPSYDSSNPDGTPVCTTAPP